MKRKAKARKPKKPSVASRHRAWSLAVRNRDGNKCQVCGRTEFLDAHHLAEKTVWRELRFEPMIGVTLCKSHHKWGRFSAHCNPAWFDRWLQANKPDQYNWLIKQIS